MKHICLAILIGITFTAQAQWTFQRTYGLMDYDEGMALRQTSDGGYILTHSMGSDIGLIKTNVSGVIQWASRYTGSRSDMPYDVHTAASTNGYAVTGGTTSYGVGSGDIFLMLTNSTGVPAVFMTYGGARAEEGRSVLNRPASGVYGNAYVMTGYTSSYSNTGEQEIFLLVTSPGGAPALFKTYGPGVGHCIRMTTDGGYIIAGERPGGIGGSIDALLLKLDVNGNVQWARVYGGTDYENARSVHQTTDGGYVLTGTTSSFGSGSQEVFVVRTNAVGTMLWSRAFGWYAPDGIDWGTAVQQTCDRGFVIAGTNQLGNVAVSNAFLVRMNPSGNLLWWRWYDVGNSFDTANGMQITSDKGYALVGAITSAQVGTMNVYLVKTNPSGNTGCSQIAQTPVVTTPPTQVLSLNLTAVTQQPSFFGHQPVVSAWNFMSSFCANVGLWINPCLAAETRR